MNKFSGIDLHSNNSVVVVSDEVDRIVYRQRLPNELPAILQALEPHRRELVGVVLESTYNWYWLVDGLQAAGYQVHLANTVAIKKYDGLKYSGDFTDAAHLAQLLRLGILPHGYICPPARRVVRDLARRRMQLVRLRTTQVLSIENVLSRQTGRRLKSNEVNRLTPEAVEGLGFPADVTLSMQANVTVMRTLQPRTVRCAAVRRRSASTSARSVNGTRRSPLKPWPTSLHALVSTSCVRASLLRRSDVFPDFGTGTTSQG